MHKQLNKSLIQVQELVVDYFDGLHHADLGKLRGIFHDKACLQAPGVRRTREEWLSLVGNRPIPHQEGHPYDYQILSIEILGSQAMVKVYCPLLGKHYLDFLGLLLEDGRWQIVNKMYADLPSEIHENKRGE